MKKPGFERIIFFVILALVLILLILSVVQLINIRATAGFSTNSNLQTAYDYSIGILVINIFNFLFMIVATVYYIRGKFLRSSALTLLMFLITFSALGAVVLGGLTVVKASNTIVIVNLIMGILEFILLAVYIFLLRRVDSTVISLSTCPPCPVCTTKIEPTITTVEGKIE